MEFLISAAGVLKTIFSLLIVLTIIVLVHEWGHYMAARLTGVRVETFSFGFGKRLFGKQIGDTDFRVSLVPFGGYIKMAGDEEWDPENLKPYEFQAKNRAQKIFILFMGPFMNMLLAFAIFTVINISGVQTEAFKNEPARIGYIVKGSPAEAADIQVGDLVLAINGKKIPDWKTLEMQIGSNANEKLQILIDRKGEKLQKTLQVQSVTKHNLGDAGLEWQYQTKIDSVEKDSPAFRGGLKEGDIVEKIDGKPVLFFEFSDRVGQSQGKTLGLTVKRKEKEGTVTRELAVTPKRVYLMESEPVSAPDHLEGLAKKAKKAFPKLSFNGYQKEGLYRLACKGFDTPEQVQPYLAQAKAQGLPFKSGERWLLGISQVTYAPMSEIHYSFFPAMGKAVKDIVNLTTLVFDAFRKMIVGKLSLGQMSGPIEIAKVSSRAMDVGASYFFLLIAFISLQLGIVNLFPIPALDGGHLLIFSLEAILRREFSQKVKAMLMNAGFIFLIGLMVFVILNDIAKNLPNGWSSFWPF